MIGKPITGRSFGGCVRYLVNKQEAAILDSEGVRIQSARSITLDFNQQRQLNPGLGKAVGHTILSWSIEDTDKLTDEIMAARAKEYMERMGISDTQYLIVRHQDRQHPHLHIVYNRVDNEGKTISDQNNYKRNVKVCRELTERYGYHLAAGKEQVNRQQLKGTDQLRYLIYDAVKAALKIASDWQELEAAVASEGIVIHYKYKGDSDEVQGISFSKDGVQFKGSAIDRSMSYTRLDQQLKQAQRLLKTQKISSVSIKKNNQPDAPKGQYQGLGHTTTPTGKNLLEILLEPQTADPHYDPAAEAYEKNTKKKGKRPKI